MRAKGRVTFGLIGTNGKKHSKRKFDFSAKEAVLHETTTPDSLPRRLLLR
jgi:hypothetical protein